MNIIHDLILAFLLESKSCGLVSLNSSFKLAINNRKNSRLLGNKQSKSERDATALIRTKEE